MTGAGRKAQLLQIHAAAARKSPLQSAPGSGCREYSCLQPKKTLPHLGGPLSDADITVPHLPRAICLEAGLGEGRRLSAKMSCYPIFASCSAIPRSLGRSDYPGTLERKLLLKPDSSWQRPDMTLLRRME